jgi:hypothetical protein
METQKTMEGIRVAIRMRPLNEREISSGQEKIFKCQTDYNAISHVKDGQPIEGQTSYFDKVFDESAANTDVYGYIGNEIVQGVMAGLNGTVFACKSSLKSQNDVQFSQLALFISFRWSNKFRKDSHHARWRARERCAVQGC